MESHTATVKSEEGPHLRRVLGVCGAAAFVVTNMVGSGIFTVPAFVRTSTGNGLATLGVWLLGALLALSGALCYAELATRMPEAGGEYHYLSRIYGKLWGFLSGWISFLVGFSAALAASSLGAAAYGAAIFGVDSGMTVIPRFNISLGSVLAVILIACLAMFHALGVRPSGRLQTIIAGSVIIAIVIFFLAGVGSGRGDWSGVTAGSKATGLWWVALIQVSFAYSGWNAAAYLAGEVRNPRYTLPRALIGGTVIVAALYLALNVLFMYALPADSWQPSIAVGRLAAEHLFGPTGAIAVSTIITLTIIGSVSSMTAAGPRVYYAMARDGLAPGIFGRLGKQGGAPTISILAQALVASILALTGAFEALLIYAGSALSLMTTLTVVSIYTLPREESDRAAGFFLTPGYPVTPAFFLILEAVAIIQGLRERPVPTGAAFLTILGGILIFYFARNRGWLDDQPIREAATRP